MELKKSDRTRQHIIEKAAPFFNKKGYADTSLMDIVHATGLTKGAIYGNFENKDDLALRVFEYNLANLQNGTTAAMAVKENAADKLLAMTEFYRQDYRHICERGGCPVMNAATEADDNFPALKVKVKAAIRQWKKLITKVIEEGQQKKTIQRKANPEKYATLLIAMIEGSVLMGKATDDPGQVTIVLDRVDEIIRTELKQ